MACPSILFNRLTLIILALVGIWLVVSAIIQLIAFNEIPKADATSLINATRIIAIIQLIVGIIVVIFVLYAIIAPQGTFKEYIIPGLEARGEVRPPLRREEVVVGDEE
jgi:hypothetical protein